MEKRQYAHGKHPPGGGYRAMLFRNGKKIQ
jgi:hypothetical protein